MRCTGSSPVLRILPMSKPTKSADRQTEPSSSSGSKRNAKPRLPNATVNVWLIRVSFLPYPRVTPSPRYTIRHPASLFLRALVRYSGRVPSRIPKRPHLEYRSPVVRCTALMTWHEGNPALAGTHGCPLHRRLQDGCSFASFGFVQTAEVYSHMALLLASNLGLSGRLHSRPLPGAP